MIENHFFDGVTKITSYRVECVEVLANDYIFGSISHFSKNLDKWTVTKYAKELQLFQRDTEHLVIDFRLCDTLYTSVI